MGVLERAPETPKVNTMEQAKTIGNTYLRKLA
jgi:hypothetical protein